METVHIKTRESTEVNYDGLGARVQYQQVLQCKTDMLFINYHFHRVASTPELATNFIDYKQMAGMTTVRKSCYYTVLSRVMR